LEGRQLFFHRVGTDSLTVAELFVIIKKAHVDIFEQRIAMFFFFHKAFKMGKMDFFCPVGAESFSWWGGNTQILFYQLGKSGNSDRRQFLIWFLYHAFKDKIGQRNVRRDFNETIFYTAYQVIDLVLQDIGGIFISNVMTPILLTLEGKMQAVTLAIFFEYRSWPGLSCHFILLFVKIKK
jgi:hypothetical protein